MARNAADARSTESENVGEGAYSGDGEEIIGATETASPALAEQLVADLLEELDERPDRKAFLLVAGVFLACYLLGRSK
ncbi:hypothetical protein LCL97_11585 [Seohaeicola saemankumensis]|nr:hypothetical protein [Seohaeicola saemankumensis]MCA0871471.1 hypothetical protein [Seohaeicola saemankumensis]